MVGLVLTILEVSPFFAIQFHIKRIRNKKDGEYGFNVYTIHVADSPYGWVSAYHFGGQPIFRNSISH
jgi:hypothetical protein